MNKLKIALAALLLTAGIAIGTTAKSNSQFVGDCSTVGPNQTEGNFFKSNCGTPGETFCCYELQSTTIVYKLP